MQGHTRSYIYIVLLFFIVFIFAIANLLSIKRHEHFEELSQQILGLPLVLLDSVEPKKQMFYKELNRQDIEQLLKVATPSKSIQELISKMNMHLQNFDRFTYQIPFKVLKVMTINLATTELLIYREGKMYGFCIIWDHQSGDAKATGFVLEQDINTYIGYDKHTLQPYPIKNVLLPSQQYIDTTLQQQASAIYQDRGISASNFS